MCPRAVTAPDAGRLAAWIAEQRWFATKARRITGVGVDDRVPLGDAVLHVLRVALDDGTVDRYAVPLRPGAAIADALDGSRFAAALLDLVGLATRARGEHGEVVGYRTRAFPSDLARPLTVRRVGGEQSNTSIVLGDRLMLKHFRRLVDGVNPDQEIGAFLTERTGFQNVPRLAGHLEYRREGRGAALGIVQELIPGARDGWQWVLAELAKVLDRAAEAPGHPERARIRTLSVPLLAALGRLGERTAELHLALAGGGEDPAFAPEPITVSDLAGWAGGIRDQFDAARAVAGRSRLPPHPDVERALASLAGCRKIRHHGDFHLGQTLRVDARHDFFLIDFEGEPARPLTERRRKHAAVRDVAGMLRSFDYAAATVIGSRQDGRAVEGWARAWEAEARDAFLAGYVARADRAPFLPPSEDALLSTVAAFEVEKAAYEILYEANHRPAWIAIPLAGLVRACARLGEVRPAGAA